MTSHDHTRADALVYQEADAPVLADALSSYAAMQRWIVTCLAAGSADREFAAHKLVVAARSLDAAKQPGPDLGRCQMPSVPVWPLRARIRMPSRRCSPAPVSRPCSPVEVRSLAEHRRLQEQSDHAEPTVSVLQWCSQASVLTHISSSAGASTVAKSASLSR
jgi:hypothetical protein